MIDCRTCEHFESKCTYSGECASKWVLDQVFQQGKKETEKDLKPIMETLHDKVYQQGKSDRDKEIIAMIVEHQKVCDAIGIVATAEWVKEQINE